MSVSRCSGPPASTSTWLDAAAAARTAVTLAAHGHRGGSYLATDGAIDPPRNVRAYSLAMQAAGVDLRERTTFTGLRTSATAGGRRVVAVETDAGAIETERVLLTGGPSLRAVGRAAGVRIPVGAARHTVAVLEPHPAFDVPRHADGLRHRCRALLAARGGRPARSAGAIRTRRPGEARSIDWAFYDAMRARLSGLVPVTADLGLRRIWVATIDYTPDHLPIVGAGPGRRRGARSRA